MRVALGHDDRTLGKAKAEELAAQLRRTDRSRATLVTMAELFDNYVREVTPTKGLRKQRHDRRAAGLFLTVLGNDLRAAGLNRNDLERFVAWRRSSGDTRSGSKRGAPIGPRIIGYDLAFVRVVLAWGSARDGSSVIHSRAYEYLLGVTRRTALS